MKCKICGYVINEDDTICHGCDNEVSYLKKHKYITNQDEIIVDKKKEKIKLNIVLLLPLIILVISIALYIFWIGKSIPKLTNSVFTSIISNMRDNVDYLNIDSGDINLHTYKVLNDIFITDEENIYNYDEYNNIDDNIFKVNNYLFNEGEIKKVLTSIKDNLVLSKYKIKYGTVFYNEHNMMSLKISYNINNVSDIINILKNNYIDNLSKIWNLSIEDTLSKLDTYYKNIKINIYTDILSFHVYKIVVDMGDSLDIDILDNKISNLKYTNDSKTVIIKDNVVTINTNDTIKITYNYDKYENDLNNDVNPK